MGIEVWKVEDRKKLKVTKALYEKLKGMKASIHDQFGREIPDPTPELVHTELGKALTMREQIQRVLRTELADQMAAQNMETFEEFMDFDIDEDPEPVQPYPVIDMIEEVPIEADPDQVESSNAQKPDSDLPEAKQKPETARTEDQTA